MTVPFAFGSATSAIPLSQLDTNFNTTITLGNTAIQLGNTVTTLNNMTLANVTISSGNVTLTNVTVTTANVTTANITTAIIGTANVTTANVATSIVTTSETLSYGTTNGVAYLNGSKVLTTGSALTFDGTNLGLSGGNPAFIGNSSSTAFYIDNRTTGKVITFRVSNAAQADTEAMTIASASGGIGAVGIGYTSLTSVGNNGLAVAGNLGIGTSSPQSKIQVNPTGAYGIGTISNAGLHISPTNITGGFATGSVIWSNYAIGGTSIQAYISAATYGANYMDFSASGTATQMRLDSSGNLGLGVTPSAWGSSERALQIGNTLSLTRGGSSEVVLAYNAYVNSSGSYIHNITANSSRYEQLAGQHRWFTAASGLAGDPITFTQAMTLDASGLLTVGNTSPAGSSQITAYGASNGQIAVQNSTNWSRLLQNAGDLYIDNGVGGSAGNIIFRSSSSTAERARIDSSGNLLVGGTTNYGPGRIAPTFNGTTTNGISLVETTDTDGSAYLAFRNSSGVAVGTVSRNGASAVAYNTSSDYRLKDNIAPMTDALAKVAALKPVTYKWKADGSDGEGFIAHELAEVVPQCVTGEKDAVDENGTPKYQGIDTSFLVATLTAAIQELKAEVDSLKSQLKGA